MSFLSSLFGKKEQFRQIPTLTQGQQGFQNEALQKMMGLLGPGGGLDLAPMEAQARSNFMGKTVPGIAEMFTNMGSGAQSSSGFQGALGSAGAGLEQNVAAMKPQFNMQMLQSLMGPGMQPGFDTYHEQAQPGLLGQLAGPGLMMGAQGGLFGRGVMNASRGQPGSAGMSNLMQMLPYLMMI